MCTALITRSPAHDAPLNRVTDRKEAAEGCGFPVNQTVPVRRGLWKGIKMDKLNEACPTPAFG